MKRSKNQAVYKFLPEMWVSEKLDSGMTVTAKIKNWNHIKMQGIYESFIENEIKRQIKMFGNRGGDTTSFDLSNDNNSFHIVETACNEGIPDIIGEMSPLVFYCSICGNTFSLKHSGQVDKYTWNCKNPSCGKNTIKQLQMIYSCECGFAQAVKIPYVKGVSELKYKPNEAQFKMFYRNGASEKPKELRETCPSCNAILLPDNASSGRNYKPFTLRIINLMDQRSGYFYEKGLEAHKAIVAHWFEKISPDDYEYILNNIDLAFSPEFRSSAIREKKEAEVRNLVQMGFVKEEQFEEIVQQMMKNEASDRSIEKYVAICDQIFTKMKKENEAAYNEWLNNFSFKLMQYNTLKYAKRVITLDDSVERQLEMEFIDSADEILDLNQKLGIKNMQVSCDIQIINTTYGYTRRVADPKNSANRNCRLKLNAFDRTREGTSNLVYGAKLDTEGILFEISQRKIIEWLFLNKIIREEQVPDLEDPNSVKKWFAENVHSDKISIFGGIDEQEKVTKHVFALLHSMSHTFINTAGEISGLSSNSLTEIIIVETASIFIYAQTSQGIPLGALSGMAESNYAFFLKKVYEESRNCIFDPICLENQKTACSACLIIPEISCNHFNVELGRKFLYSYRSLEPNIIGFWEMI